MKTLYLDKNASSPPKLKNLRTESIDRFIKFPHTSLVRIRKWTENGRISTDIFISCGKKYRPINLTKNAIRPSPSTLSLITRPFMDLSKSSPKVQCHSFRTWTEWVDLNLFKVFVLFCFIELTFQIICVFVSSLVFPTRPASRRVS